MPAITCHSCEQTFADYKALALHIMTSPRKTHRKGRRWAAKYLLKSRQLDRRVKNDRTPFEMTDEDRANKRSTERVLSGQNGYAITVCPKCRTKRQESLPIEFIKDLFTWRIGDALAVLCGGCRGSR